MFLLLASTLKQMKIEAHKIELKVKQDYNGLQNYNMYIWT